MDGGGFDGGRRHGGRRERSRTARARQRGVRAAGPPTTTGVAVSTTPITRVRRSLSPLRQGWQRRIAARRVPVAPARGVVSLTFDDVPRSAYTTAAPLLEAAGHRGTFYVAAALGEGASGRPPVEHLRADDIADLHRRGHQIGCHTYSHRLLVPGAERDLVADCRRNRDVLAAVIDEPIEDFAFPFGRFSYRAKRALAGGYASLRGTQSGLNVGTCDLSQLYCVALTAGEFDAGRVRALLEDCARRRGWLLFFTHGVVDDPDVHDIDPDRLAWVVRELERLELDCRPVAEARRAIDPGRTDPAGSPPQGANASPGSGRPA